MDDPQAIAASNAPTESRGMGLGKQILALVVGAIALAFIGVYFNKRRERERTPKEAADAAVKAAIAERAAIDAGLSVSAARP